MRRECGWKLPIFGGRPRIWCGKELGLKLGAEKLWKRPGAMRQNVRLRKWKSGTTRNWHDCGARKEHCAPRQKRLPGDAPRLKTPKRIRRPRSNDLRRNEFN